MSVLPVFTVFAECVSIAVEVKMCFDGHDEK